jgi:hypothetical protein
VNQQAQHHLVFGKTKFMVQGKEESGEMTKKSMIRDTTPL